jgi:hypothetical protein
MQQEKPAPPVLAISPDAVAPNASRSLRPFFLRGRPFLSGSPAGFLFLHCSIIVPQELHPFDAARPSGESGPRSFPRSAAQNDGAGWRGLGVECHKIVEASELGRNSVTSTQSKAKHQVSLAGRRTNLAEKES